MIAETAAAAAAKLAPLMPYLLEAGTAVAGGISKGFGDAIGKAGGQAAWDAAMRMWERVVGRADDRDGVKAAAQSVGLEPDHPATQELLARALKRLFEREPELAEAIGADLGGPQRVQEMLAEDGGRLKDVAQRLSGPGRQSMAARRGGSIEGGTQIQTQRDKE